MLTESQSLIFARALKPLKYGFAAAVCAIGSGCSDFLGQVQPVLQSCSHQ
jgi:hypothetical protein